MISGPDITCTPATPADATALTALVQQFYSEGGLAFTAATRIALDQLLNDSSFGIAGLLSHEGTLAGYFVLTFGYSLERGGKTALLDELFILPTFQNRGYGKAAVQHAITQARANGCCALLLEVDHNNPRARHVYEATGFIAPGRDVMVFTL